MQLHLHEPRSYKEKAVKLIEAAKSAIENMVIEEKLSEEILSMDTSNDLKETIETGDMINETVENDSEVETVNGNQQTLNATSSEPAEEKLQLVRNHVREIHETPGGKCFKARATPSP